MTEEQNAELAAREHVALERVREFCQRARDWYARKGMKVASTPRINPSGAIEVLRLIEDVMSIEAPGQSPGDGEGASHAAS